MSWFKKKKIESIPTSIIEPKIKECQHIWCDFSPYIAYEFEYENKEISDFGTLKIIIYEPYVCCNCSKRETIELSKDVYYHIKYKEIKEIIEKKKQEHQNFTKPRARVEDEINDLIHKIDRNLLQTIGVYQPQKLGSTFSSTSQLPILETFLKEKNNG